MDYTITMSDGTKVDADLDCWKRWQKEYEETLLNGKEVTQYTADSDKPNKVFVPGISKEIIDGIELSNTNSDGSVELLIRSSKGFVDITNHDIRGLALARWLIKNAKDRGNSTFREQKNKLEMLRVAKYTRSLLEEIEENKPIIETGKKAYANIAKAQNQKNGTKEERTAKKKKYQDLMDRIHNANQSVSHSAAAKAVSADLKKSNISVSYKTICRNTNKW
jgi:hypothetical protein